MPVFRTPDTLRPDATEVAAAVSVVLRGADDAVVALRGPVDLAGERRFRSMLRAVVDAGARHVIVDLSEATDVPGRLPGVLATACRELRRRGGWLLVEGDLGDSGHDGEDTVRHDGRDAGCAAGGPVEDELGLMDAFAAYREAVAPAGLGPAVPVAG
ncbi:MAG TPA: STAS domain-containing protein [Pseudonocardia sp.]|nr:STAS domain-containing protein [Pseudonocardia sp.]